MGLTILAFALFGLFLLQVILRKGTEGHIKRGIVLLGLEILIIGVVFMTRTSSGASIVWTPLFIVHIASGAGFFASVGACAVVGLCSMAKGLSRSLIPWHARLGYIATAFFVLSLLTAWFVFG